MVLVDSNIWLDIFEPRSEWFDWSSQTMAQLLPSEPLAINPLIFAELCYGFETEVEVEQAMAAFPFKRLELPYAAAFRASRAFRLYKKNKGQKRSPMPDFYIGAHAEVAGLKLLTRDVPRFRTYFPSVALLTPPGV